MKREDITGIFPDATAEQINSLMGINGNDINRAKGNYEELQSQLTAANQQIETLQASAGELETERQKSQAFETELNSLKAANAIRDMREKVSTETGVPVSLLTMDTEEACKSQAEGILNFSKPTYPKVTDGGEVSGTMNKSTRQQFADWFNQQ